MPYERSGSPGRLFPYQGVKGTEARRTARASSFSSERSSRPMNTSPGHGAVPFGRLALPFGHAVALVQHEKIGRIELAHDRLPKPPILVARTQCLGIGKDDDQIARRRGLVAMDGCAREVR